ncbi:MAG: hypothetical protein FJW20_16795 [Acidimicrobiia bacterium]|nr:hypothetical protein [Acidimicrobiia bacterium]
MSRTGVLGLFMALVLIVPGCGKKKPATVLVVPTPPPPPPPEPIPAPPEVKSSATQLPEVPAPEIPVPTRPPAPRTPPQRQAQQAGAHPTEPAAQPATPAPSVPQPRLTQLLSPQEQQSYHRAIEEAIRRTEASLASLAGKRLTKEQSINLERTRTFLRQARETRQADLVTARSLAQRAEVLAEDLVKSLR